MSLDPMYAEIKSRAASGATLADLVRFLVEDANSSRTDFLFWQYLLAALEAVGESPPNLSDLQGI